MAIELGDAEALRNDKKRLVRLTGISAIVLVALIIAFKSVIWFSSGDPIKNPEFWKGKCEQPEVLQPMGRFANATQFLEKDYRDFSAELLSGAVRIPTESFDDMNQDPLQEERFEVFSKLHAYLNSSFPLASKHLEIVNGYGLLYTIKGESHSLPSVFMAHQDVVPVEPDTIDKWSYEPFSGYYDGERIWGRGSSDTKSSLIASLEAVENLLHQQWTPKRDVLLAFGFDEELDGSRGAGHLAQTIRNRYDNEVYMIVDEGSGVSERYGSTFAIVGISEKGYTDIEVRVHTPGGPKEGLNGHTGIGIASEMVVQLEKHKASHSSGKLTQDDVTSEVFTCIAAYGADISMAEKKIFIDHNLLYDYLVQDRNLRPLVSTTQAIDVISGNLKVNAVPEKVSFIANYRIDVHESVESTTDGVQRQAEDVASRHGLGLVRNSQVIFEPTSAGYIELVNGQSLEPAPVSPHSLENDPWRLLSGTSRHVLEEYFDIDRVYMAGLVLSGNTDTVHYWGLTDNIYRFTLALPDSGANAHTVDEWTTVDSHLATVAWYYEMLQFI